jgi:hypothetical protein
MMKKERGNRICVEPIFPLIFLSVLLFFSSTAINPKAYAQFIPLPSTDSSKHVPKSGYPVREDHEPPVISFVTNTLQTGNSVFKVDIMDKSGIELCKVIYSREGKDVVLDCVKDHGNSYKALINIDSSVPHNIQVYAKDGNGNSSIVVKKLSVLPQKNIFEQIFDRLLHLF